MYFRIYLPLGCYQHNVYLIYFNEIACFSSQIIFKKPAQRFRGLCLSPARKWQHFLIRLKTHSGATIRRSFSQAFSEQSVITPELRRALLMRMLYMQYTTLQFPDFKISQPSFNNVDLCHSLLSLCNYSHASNSSELL